MEQNKKENRPPVLYASLDDFMPIVEERIRSGRSVEFSPRGISMLPLIREGKDSVLLSPAEFPLKKFDIPLYRRKNGKYVLHRVVRVEDGSYTMSGDNQFVYEKGIREDQVIAVVSSIRRGGRLISARSSGLMIYAFLWQATRSLRHFAFRVLRKIKSVFFKK